LHRRHGARDTATWVAGLTGDRRSATRRDVDLAGQLGAAPVVAAALSVGDVSKAQAAELVHAAELPAAVQHDLVRRAGRVPVERLADEVHRARLHHGVETPAVPAELHLHRSAVDVRMEARFELGDGEFVDVAVHTAVDRLGLPTDMPMAQRRAVGLVSICRHFIDHVDQPPQTRTGRPHVLALVPLDTLEARTGGTAELASGAVITGDTARRLACDAVISRIITNGPSEILDVGRSTRAIPTGPAKAVIARDKHCQHERCTAPPWACEIHHRQPWAAGGPTTLANLELRCWHHHQYAHEQHGPPERAPDQAA
jgi:uncharacterized protein DUF222/HNH endonuclease